MKWKLVLIIIVIFGIIGITLGSIIIGSQYMLEKHIKENPRPVCNETTNETDSNCYNYNHMDTNYGVAYAFIFPSF